MTLTRPRLSYMLAGGVSLAALVLVVKLDLPFDRPGSVTPYDAPTVSTPVDTDADKREEQPGPAVAQKPVAKDTLAQRPAAPAPKAAGEAAPAEAEIAVAPPPPPVVAEQAAPGAGPAVVGVLPAPQTALSAARSRQMAPAAGLAAPSPADATSVYQDQGRDRFANAAPNPLKLVADEPVSTFSADVDTASYAFVRSSINRGVMPPADAVRVEELINYFPYDYPAPADAAEPFKATVDVMPTPWNGSTKLLRIGIKGYVPPQAATPHANLVFLIDTSGSMNAPNKLPLLVSAFKLLLTTLKPDDTVAIVTYAGSAGTVLEPTKISDKAKILSALDRLAAGGSTAGAAGILEAYRLAESTFDKDGVNRVVLATDGDFNVGISDPEALKRFIEDKRGGGVTLSVLGFGEGNYNDQLMQALAQNGNGNAAYIDSLSEARKVLVAQAGGTLFTIAKDVKLQVEFNPATVATYRLIGYETRALRREDFNNDKIDAGDIGAGHTVTALYELTPVGAEGTLVDSLRYQQPKPAAPAAPAAPAGQSDEYAFVKIRYKAPDGDTSKLITTPVTPAEEVGTVAAAPEDARFAAAVAGFGQLLTGGQYTGTFSYGDVLALAREARGADPENYRGEFLNLVELAKTIDAAGRP